ncbi:hypothetical protein BDV93DRAFT_230988 [Ceratobasidium sp. AG-I]|nr:hypothetical protein BDV93DRAFT_230988 [Ceratobasidium sp. AG-I]
MFFIPADHLDLTFMLFCICDLCCYMFFGIYYETPEKPKSGLTILRGLIVLLFGRSLLPFCVTSYSHPYQVPRWLLLPIRPPQGFYYSNTISTNRKTWFAFSTVFQRLFPSRDFHKTIQDHLPQGNFPYFSP